MAKTRKETFQFMPSEHHRHLMAQTEQALAYDGGDVAAWQKRLRPRVRALLGDWPSERPSLDVKTIWRRSHPLGSIEKIVFASEAGADVPAYICLPAAAAPPYRFAICVQGHSSGMHHSIAVQREDETKPMEVEGDRDFGLICMKYGLAALCIEQRAFGERRQRQPPDESDQNCYAAAMHALQLGRTLIGERVFDVDRAIDYLAERGDVDMARIGVMGNSGGGTTSLFSAAMLPRLAYAMPSCYFCTFADSIMSIHHCLCNYVPGLLKVAEMADIMGLFAPKPVVIVAGKEDPIFPIKAVRREFRRLRSIYKAAGADGCCHLVEGDGGHRFYGDDAWPVMLKAIDRIGRS